MAILRLNSNMTTQATRAWIYANSIAPATKMLQLCQSSNTIVTDEVNEEVMDFMGEQMDLMFVGNICMTFSSDTMDTTTDQDTISEAEEPKVLHGTSQVEEAVAFAKATAKARYESTQKPRQNLHSLLPCP